MIGGISVRSPGAIPVSPRPSGVKAPIVARPRDRLASGAAPWHGNRIMDMQFPYGAEVLHGYFRTEFSAWILENTVQGIHQGRFRP